MTALPTAELASRALEHDTGPRLEIFQDDAGLTGPTQPANSGQMPTANTGNTIVDRALNKPDINCMANLEERLGRLLDLADGVIGVEPDSAEDKVLKQEPELLSSLPGPVDAVRFYKAVAKQQQEDGQLRDALESAAIASRFDEGWVVPLSGKQLSPGKVESDKPAIDELMLELAEQIRGQG